MISNKDSSLPNGWKWKKLGEIAKLFVGSSAPQDNKYFSPDGPPFYRVSDISKYGRTDTLVESANQLSEVALNEFKLVPVKAGTIVFPKSGAAVKTNNRAIIEKDGYLVSHLMAVQANQDIAETKWLYWYLCQIDLMKYSDNDQYPSLKQSVVEKLEVPLPSLPEQKRIAAILTEQLAAVEKARKASEARLEAVRALPAAYLREVFESEESKGWPTVRLEDVSHIVSGITLGRKLSDSRNVQKIPYLRVANVKDGFLDLSSITSIEATENEIEKLQLQYGDLLLTEGGDPDKLGRGTVWQKEIDECIHQNHIFRVRFVTDDVNPFFASFQMQSKYGKEYFLRHAKQTTGIATINQQVLRAFPLLIPPRDIQDILVKQLGNRLKQANMANNLIKEELSYISNVAPALLRQAFSGDL